MTMTSRSIRALLCIIVVYFGTSIGASQVASDSVLLVFADGRQSTISAWAFLYEFVESDNPPPDRTIIRASEFKQLKSRELLLSLQYAQGARQTSGSSRRIKPTELLGIKFQRNEGSVQAIISLKGGETITITPSSGFTPAKELLTAKQYIYAGGICPCIYLVGAGRTGDSNSSPRILLTTAGLSENANERLVELRFNAP